MAMEHEWDTPSNAVHSVGSLQSPYKRMNIYCDLAKILFVLAS